MEGLLVLHFGSPVPFGVSKKGEFGAHRPYGPHKGVDFAAPRGTVVKTIESGLVVVSKMVEGSKKKTRYGNVVVIDHTPGAGNRQSHIYSLSAHLESRSVYAGQRVEAASILGRSGNSGMRQYYNGEEQGYHLHFEIIKSNARLDWTESDLTDLTLRVDPISGYVNAVKTIDYGTGDNDEATHIPDSVFHCRMPFAGSGLQPEPDGENLDCRVAPLLAMTAR